MNVITPQNFKNGWIDRLTGEGSKQLIENGTIIKLSSPNGLENGSIIDFMFPVNNGDTIEFEILARSIKGNPKIAIDLFDVDGSVTFMSIVSKDIKGSEFKKYNIKTTIPYLKDTKLAKIALGVWNSISDESEVEFMNPRLIVNSNNGVLQTMASGLIVVNNNTFKIHDSFKNTNVENVKYNTDKKEINVTITTPTHFRQRPIILVSSTPDSPFIALGGKWENSTRTFSISMTDGTELQDLSTGVYYINFEVKG